MIDVSLKSAKPFSKYEALKFKFPRKERENIVFLNASIKMKNDRICDVIVTHIVSGTPEGGTSI